MRFKTIIKINKNITLFFLIVFFVSISYSVPGYNKTEKQNVPNYLEHDSCSSFLDRIDSPSTQKLTSDINCSGQSISGANRDYSGYKLYGNNHKIYNLDINKKPIYINFGRSGVTDAFYNVEFHNPNVTISGNYAGSGLIAESIGDDAVFHNVTVSDYSFYVTSNADGSSIGVLYSRAYGIGHVSNVITSGNINCNNKDSNGDVYAVADGKYSGSNIVNKSYSTINFKNCDSYNRYVTNSKGSNYYDVNTTNAVNATATGLTTSEMRNSNNFVDWDFNNNWSINNNRIFRGRPYIKNLNSAENPAPNIKTLKPLDGGTIKPNKSITYEASDDESTGTIEVVNSSSGYIYKSLSYNFGTEKTISTSDIKLFSKSDKNYSYRVDVIDNYGTIASTTKTVTTIDNKKPKVNSYDVSPDFLKNTSSMSFSANVSDSNQNQNLDVNVKVYKNGNLDTTIDLTDGNNDDVYDKSNVYSIDSSTNYTFNLTASDGIVTVKNTSNKYSPSSYLSGNVFADGFEDDDLNELPEWSETENGVVVAVNDGTNIKGDNYVRFLENQTSFAQNKYATLKTQYNTSQVSNDITFGTKFKEQNSYGDKFTYKLTYKDSNSNTYIDKLFINGSGSNRKLYFSQNGNNVELGKINSDTSYSFQWHWDNSNSVITGRLVNADNNNVLAQETYKPSFGGSTVFSGVYSTTIRYDDVVSNSSDFLIDDYVYQGSRNFIPTKFYYLNNYDKYSYKNDLTENISYKVQSEAGGINTYINGNLDEQKSKERGNKTFEFNKNLDWGNNTFQIRYIADNSNQINDSKKKWIYKVRNTSFSNTKPLNNSVLTANPTKRNVTYKTSLNASNGTLNLYRNDTLLKNFSHTDGYTNYSYTENNLDAGYYNYKFNFSRFDGNTSTTGVNKFEIANKAEIEIINPKDSDRFDSTTNSIDFKANFTGAKGDIIYYLDNNKFKNFSKLQTGETQYTETKSLSNGYHDFKVRYVSGRTNKTKTITFKIKNNVSTEWDVTRPKNNYTYSGIGNKNFEWFFKSNEGNSTIKIDNSTVYTFKFGGGSQNFDLTFSINSLGSHEWQHIHKTASGTVKSKKYTFYVKDESITEDQKQNIENEYDEDYQQRELNESELRDKIKNDENLTDETTDEIVDEIINSTTKLDERLIADTDTESNDPELDKYVEEYKPELKSGSVETQNDLTEKIQNEENVDAETAQNIAEKTFKSVKTVNDYKLPAWLVEIINLKILYFIMGGAVLGFVSNDGEIDVTR